jgi:hypothetical protein
MSHPPLSLSAKPHVLTAPKCKVIRAYGKWTEVVEELGSLGGSKDQEQAILFILKKTRHCLSVHSTWS